MDQIKIGVFLKDLRKEKSLTQEQLAEKLNVSGRTVSRWETGITMPDISTLVEIADFYDISISEIIEGERKSENMNQDTKETAIQMAQYSHNEVKIKTKRVISILMTAFGIFVIISALAIIPSDSSWGSIYSILGGILFLVGVYLMLTELFVKRAFRILSIVGCGILLFGFFSGIDYIAVSQFQQVPRFCYEKTYGDEEIICKTLFFTAIWKNPGTENEEIEIVK